jgi:hypothetical protein
VKGIDLFGDLSIDERIILEVKQSYPCALTEHHAMKAYWGNGVIAPLIL